MPPLEDYALLGDGESAALVSRDGAVDWLCWPRFDSDACFAALIGEAENGFWRLAPAAGGLRTRRRYRGDTLVLETEHENAGGAVRVVDFMPLRDTRKRLVRQVTGLAGSVDMRLDLRLRFDYGYVGPWLLPQPDGVLAVVGPSLVVLRSPVPTEIDGCSVRAAFRVEAGDVLSFEIAYGASHEPPPPACDAAASLAATSEAWQSWADRFHGRSRWRGATMRSLLTLKALIHRPTGGLIAAPTTSLPERWHGSANWDYRFCWLRDATFTLSALLNAGYHEEARGWRDWMLRAVGGEVAKLRIMYRVDGARRLFEHPIPWLGGYEGARPVRAGNDAAAQRQLDVHGELLDSMDIAQRAGIAREAHGIAIETALARRLAEIWTDTGHGLWEDRGEPRHYTYSKAMAWVGLDRVRRGLGGRPGMDGDLLRRLGPLCDTIRAEILREGWNDARGHFVQYYGGDQLDASLLLLPLVGFLPADDPRMRATIAAIERDLTREGLVLRLPPTQGEEGAFIACTCWLAECLGMQGRQRDAEAALERVLALRNDLGLLSEEYDITRKRLTGNFPQALSHLALVNATLGLSGPVLQRGGG